MMRDMGNPRISIISAIAKGDRAIGKNNALLWHIPEDMQHFRKLTTGHTVVMGENTFKSIGRPLPNRMNIVLSFDEQFNPEGCLMARSMEEALNMARQSEAEEIFIIGGASIYKQCIVFAERLYLTLVDGSYEADTFFPEYSDFTKVVSEEKMDNGQYTFSFIVLEKETH
ncbi:MAG TPA: dihydrofolate reductase [Patescibacteria group bacterium]|nr:dihydrofolate reductase [Patescibacteria group bacterium]